MSRLKPVFEVLRKSRRSASAAVIESLNRQKPVSVGLDNNLFLNRPYSNTPQSVSHAVLIIGSRPTANGCEFLLRDVRGTDCSKYMPGWQERCHGGNFWITEKELNDSTASVTSIQKVR